MSLRTCLQTQRSEDELYEMIEAVHLVRIDSKMPVPRGAVPVRLSGKSGLVTQAMLCDVDRSWQVSDLEATVWRVCGAGA